MQTSEIKNYKLTHIIPIGKERLLALEAIRGIWKEKRITNPVAWQRKIRQDRKTPSLHR